MARPGLLHRAPGVQAQLRVSRPGDAHEQEAERVASAVVQQPTPEAGERSSAPAASRPAGPLSHVLGSGRPLPDRERGFFEAHLGHDLGGVRVHDDARAADATARLGARAVAAGADVAFGPGEYAPGTDRGRRLLAHELTHVVQQQTHAAPGIQRQVAPTATSRTQVELECPGSLQNARVIVATPWQAAFGVGHPANVGESTIYLGGVDASGARVPQGSYGIAPGASQPWYVPPPGTDKIVAACDKSGKGPATLEYDTPVA